MNRRALLPSILLTAVAFGQDIHLKTRTIATPAKELAARRPLAAHTVDAELPQHLIVQFEHPPGVEDLDSLAADATLVAALPDNAVVVSGLATRFAARSDVRWLSTFDPEDKISPAIDRISDDSVAVVVEFHSDVERARQEDLLTQAGVMWNRPDALLPNHIVVLEKPDVLRTLARQDEIDYIFPADPDLENPGLNACAGMLTMAGPLAQYANVVHGWDLDADHLAHLAYVFGAITPKVPAATVQAEVLRAMNEWSRNAGLVFQAGSVASAVRTIQIKFVSGAHGDAYPFDGPGGTLAHTFYPVPVNPESIAGDMHLDADEKWHAGGDVDIYSVALHELGHAIGLGHSDKPGDVMYPYYRRGMVLSANDIGAARSLYGMPAGSAPPAPVTAPSVDPLRISVDAPPASVTSALVALTGEVRGGEGPFTIQWLSDQGYSGNAVIGSGGMWTASGIALTTGGNSISFTAFDSAHRSASQTVIVNKSVPPAAGANGSTPVSVRIASPAGSVVTTNQTALTVSGTSAGGAGVVRVAWQTAAGSSGVAVGTDRWSAAGIPLLTGTNTVIVRAYDAKGMSGWASLVVVKH